MGYLKNKFMNVTIRSKMIFSYILVALIPLCMFGLLLINVFAGQAEDSVSEHTDQMMSQVRTSVDVYINSIEKMSDYIIRELNNFNLDKQTTEASIFWEQETKGLSVMLENIEKSHPEIAGILVATENDMYVSTGMTRISRDSFTEEEWYKQAVENPYAVQIIGNTIGRNIITNKGYSIDDVFSLVKAVVDKDTQKVVGVLLFDIKHDIISKSIESITIGEKGFVFVMDQDKHIVYTQTNKVVYRVNPLWLEQDEEIPINVSINGEKYQIRYETSDYTKWKIVGVFSLDEIMGKIETMRYVLSMVLMVTVLIIIVIALKISQTITNPIIELKKAMKETEKGNLKVRFKGNYQDEISELGRNFNQMLEQIEALVQMVYMEQKNKRIAELKVLREQIKPHFLYNTLDTINWMAREYEADDIVKLVDALTNMFRIGLSKGKDYISLEQEIKYVSNYLYIQKIRYRNKLNYEIIIDEAVKDYEVPKLILQPLVENAIYHGIKMKRGDGHLVIRVSACEEEYIECSVEDDGSGMNEQKVKELTQKLNKPCKLENNESFGLFYIKERLRIRYGNGFHIQVESEEGVGTKVSILIPYQDDGNKGGTFNEE